MVQSFLGDSQTFLGVLASLIMMCIICSEGNFLVNILENIGNKKRAEARIRMNEMVAASMPDKLKESADYKSVKNHLQSDKDAYEKKLIEVSDSVDNLHTGLSNLNRERSSRRWRDVKRHIGQAAYLAPMYTLGFIMVMFVFDELCRCLYDDYSEAMTTIMVAFTLLSISFWAVIWSMYLVRKHKRKGFSSKTKAWLGAFREGTSCGNICMSVFVKLLYVFLIDIVLISIASLFSTALYFRETLWIVVFAVPLVTLGICKDMRYVPKVIRVGAVEGESHDYWMLICHFLLFLGLSVLVFLYAKWFVGAMGLPCVTFNAGSLFALKTVCFIFVIANGLLMPFLMPMGTYVYGLSRYERNLSKTFGSFCNIHKEMTDNLHSAVVKKGIGRLGYKH